MVTHEVWISMVVEGRIVVKWEISSMTSMGGMCDSLRIEGWFAVFDECALAGVC